MVTKADSLPPCRIHITHAAGLEEEAIYFGSQLRETLAELIGGLELVPDYSEDRVNVSATAAILFSSHRLLIDVQVPEELEGCTLPRDLLELVYNALQDAIEKLFEKWEFLRELSYLLNVEIKQRTRGLSYSANFGVTDTWGRYVGPGRRAR